MKALLVDTGGWMAPAGSPPSRTLWGTLRRAGAERVDASTRYALALVWGMSATAEAPAPVLILEDDVPLANALARLVRLRTEPIIAGTMEAANKVLAECDLAAAIIDVGLPDGDGLDTVRDIRLSRPLLPVLVLTALNDRAIPNRANALRAEFAYKPPERDNIVPFVERALALREGFERAVATALGELLGV
jgi:DNA-binding NtrC family response regulator